MTGVQTCALPISAALDVNGMVWKSSPAATELKQVALGWLRQWLGLPDDFFGIIYDTASVSSMHAIAAARELFFPEVREYGGLSGAVMYCSEHAHSSIDKGAIALGVGHKNVRKVPVDAEFRMLPGQLERMIGEDRAAGRKPFCVVATTGTTSTTSVDPVAEIADIAERHGKGRTAAARRALRPSLAPRVWKIGRASCRERV